MRAARITGGLYEGKRGRTLRLQSPDESFIRSRISQFLDDRFVIHSVTDSRLVKTNTGWTRCVFQAGWPDITAILPITGQTWAIECKTQTGEMRESQIDLLPQLTATNALVTVARDIIPIRDILNEHFAKFSVAQINEYKDMIRRLRAEAARRATEREELALTKSRRTKKLSKTVVSAEPSLPFSTLLHTDEK